MATAFSRFLAEVEAVRSKLDFYSDEECFYRGHTNSDWPLLPTLLRHCAENDITESDKIRYLEADLYFEFRARAAVIQSDSQSDWETLFSMRHHAVATRLLDWTEVLGIAIYFALKNATSSSSPCVWLLNPYRLNEISWDGVRDLIAPEHLPQGDYDYSDYLIDYSKNAGFDWDEPVAIYPLRKNMRLHSQRGYFTIHGEDTRPLDEIVPEAVARVKLIKSAWLDARRFLDDYGINEYVLFPDLDGLARHLHQKYKI
jgi:hypothetical protein